MEKSSARRLLVAAVVFAAAFGAYAAEPAAARATVTVRNETGYYLVEVNSAAESEADWSESVLGEGVAIRPFKEMDVRVAPGYASLRALFDVDGTEVEVVEEAELEAGVEYVWTITEEAVWESYGANSGDENDTYGYYDDTYGYSGYEYFDDTYGYYGE